MKEYVKLVENNIYGQNQGRNVMKNIKVIMCDIDGTLLNSKGIVTSKTIDAIKKVREQGILFGISTGRDVPNKIPCSRTFFIASIVLEVTIPLLFNSVPSISHIITFIFFITFLP